MKLFPVLQQARKLLQPPSGGCVLKPDIPEAAAVGEDQPPSGGCVLKLINSDVFGRFTGPAAFRRLCVETRHPLHHRQNFHPAAFRRLCVETNKFKEL